MNPHVVGRAADLLARFDAVVPADGDALRELCKERGWVEALKYLAERGLLTPAGVTEVGHVLAASGEWADGLAADDRGVSPAADPGPIPCR